MRKLNACAGVAGILLLTAVFAGARPAEDHGSLVLVFKDGHRQTLSVAQISSLNLQAPSVLIYRDGRQEKLPAGDIVRIEFEPAMIVVVGRAHYIGKWEVGDGQGKNFFITLEENGDASKTIGAAHGTWAVVDGEARISWDDGWHDAIRKVGSKHEKFAYEPGRSFDDQPSNVTAARNTQAKPI